MRYLMLVIDNTSNSATEDEMPAINAFNDQMREDGNFVMACGLAAPKESIVVDNRKGANLIQEAPLFPNEEQFSGFWVIEVGSPEKARELALGGSKACNRKIELRRAL